MSWKQSDQRFVLRTIKNGCVRIRGVVFRPDARGRAYDGRLEGQRWLFGLYWGPANYDYFDADGWCHAFVFLWGAEAAATARTEEESAREWPGPNCIDGTFHWQWWHSEYGARRKGI